MSASYTLDDLDIDFGDLRGLLDATYDILHEMPYERDGKRDNELDRVASLIRIAQQFSEQIGRNLDDIGPRNGSLWVSKEAAE
jgi:hypothetical protein